MKRILFISTLILILIISVSAFADMARFVRDDGNTVFHSEHLYLHIGSKNCKTSGNYIKIRTEAGGNKVIGHLEMADTFTLDEISDHWARITVVRASKTSPDSHDGLTGWVDANYIECPCSSEEYYENNPRLTYALAVTVQKTTHLREEPSKISTSFSQLKEGEQVEVIAEYTGKDKNLWYRVRSAKGVMGYIRSDMLEITESEIPEFPQSEETLPPVNQTATEAPAPQETAAPNTGWPDAYYQYIVGGLFRYQLHEGETEYYSDPLGLDYFPNRENLSGESYPVSFALYDWDLDGTPELFAYDGSSGKSGNYYAFTFRNGQMMYLGEAGSGWSGLLPYRDVGIDVIFSRVIDGPFTEISYARLGENGTMMRAVLAGTEEIYMGEDQQDQVRIVDGPYDQELYDIYNALFSDSFEEDTIRFKSINDRMDNTWWNDFVANYYNTLDQWRTERTNDGAEDG